MNRIIDLSDTSIGCRTYHQQSSHQPLSYFSYEDILDALYNWRTPAEYKLNFINTSEFTRIEDRFHLGEKAEKFVPKEYYSKFTNGRWAYRLIGSNIQPYKGFL